MRPVIRSLLVSLLLLSAVEISQPPQALATRATPAATQEHQQAVAITVYNGNLGLVKDIRKIQLAPGLHDLKFMDVAAQINPTTVHLKSLTDPGGLRILEQNYEFDLLNPQKLLEKYVGKRVKLWEKNYYTGEERLVEALLLGVSGGPIYQIDGAIYLGHPGRVILPSIPENLIARPTLVWRIENSLPQSQVIEATYLTRGITWRADYVLTLNAEDDRGDLAGWVTIDNRSGANYKDATLKLVAGDVNRAKDEREMAEALMRKAARAEAPKQAFEEEGFFEYHLYSLDGKTTIKQNQSKQISLLSASDVPIRKEMIYYGAHHYYRNRYGTPISNQKVGVYLEVANTKDNRLGIPLPKGVVRVYKADRSGSLQFIGEDRIDHTPKDEQVKIKMGEAFDVVGERIQKDWRKIAWRVYEVEWEISLRNHKAEDVEVTVIEPIPGDWQVLHASHSYQKVEAHTLKFPVKISKDSGVKVKYRVRLTF
ncbi:MAG: DUF4139 domain-containing protein [Candidatus Methylomirabilales bacterium]